MRNLVVSLLLFFSISIHAQDTLKRQSTFNISGFVRDSNSGETIIGATVQLDGSEYSSTTNVYGFYSLQAPKGKYILLVNLGNISVLEKEIDLNSNFTLNLDIIRIENTSNIVITGRKNNNVRRLDMSTRQLSSATIQKIPAFLGEADVIKSIQLLPGVTTVGEGATGFNVRGGGIDQNLILMDEAPVFNSAHLFGFFSIFNPDVVKDVQLVTGGIPANYGGRLSSTLDVRLKEGNNKKFQANGGIGTIFSRLTLEGPIIKNKMSFVVAARRSYIDILAKPFLSKELKDSRFNFYDLTAKINYSKGRNNYYVSAYSGDDIFGAPNAFDIRWGNTTLTARWNHVYNKKLFSNFTYYYSRYRYNIIFKNRDITFNWRSFIVNNSLKLDYNYFLNNKNTIAFGAQSTYYIFKPGNATVKSSTGELQFGLKDKFGLESAAYITNDYNTNGKFSVRYGMRLSHFAYLGAGKAYTFKAGETEASRKRLDKTEEFRSNEVIADYFNLEPRLGIKYQLNKQQSIKASYNRMVQNLHLISNTAASIPFDVWQPTSNNIKPEIADQMAIGYFRNFEKKNIFEFSIETYYKNMLNQVDYIDGADLFLNEYLEGELLSGIGRAYGAELYLKKATGKLTGWISYTFSRSERKIRGINDGDWFPNRFDRTHNLYVVAQYSLNKKWDFAANFVLSSGTPTTFYSSQYTIQGYIVPDPGGSIRNNIRNPYYHRLDVSATMHIKKRKNWESNWVFSVYNAYNRRNPFSIYFATNYLGNGSNEAIRFSVIGSFVPAVSYNFKWR